MEGTKTYRKILLATDGSLTGRYATECALKLARDLDANICALYVINTHVAFSLGIYFHRAIREMTEEGKETIVGILQQAERLGIKAAGFFAAGKPGERICQAVVECQADVVVIRDDSRSAIENALLGSVSQYVLRHANRPVLVVRDQVGQRN